jgi:hypothetical protein
MPFKKNVDSYIHSGLLQVRKLNESHKLKVSASTYYLISGKVVWVFIFTSLEDKLLHAEQKHVLTWEKLS